MFWKQLGISPSNSFSCNFLLSSVWVKWKIINCGKLETRFSIASNWRKMECGRWNYSLPSRWYIEIVIRLRSFLARKRLTKCASTQGLGSSLQFLLQFRSNSIAYAWGELTSRWVCGNQTYKYRNSFNSPIEAGNPPLNWFPVSSLWKFSVRTLVMK